MRRRLSCNARGLPLVIQRNTRDWSQLQWANSLYGFDFSWGLRAQSTLVNDKKKNFYAKTFDVLQNWSTESSQALDHEFSMIFRAWNHARLRTSPERSADSKDGGRVLLTACDMSVVHCLMQILTAFFFIVFVSPCVRLCNKRNAIKRQAFFEVLLPINLRRKRTNFSFH